MKRSARPKSTSMGTKMPERRTFYLLPFQWIFEGVVDDIFGWNNFPRGNYVGQLN
jgi:hypothetical protein